MPSMVASVSADNFAVVVVVVVETVAVVVVVAVAVVLVAVVVVVDVAVFVVEVTVVVVVVQPPLYDALLPSHLPQTRFEVTVPSCTTYSPALHTASGEHSLSSSPGVCGLDSYSPSAHSCVVVQTTLDTAVGSSFMYSLFPHVPCCAHSVLVCPSMD